ncbi:hypothetical protein MMSR116_05910 [Methylobacterium mesophilicum SR1.6/6]|uniref:Phage tail protein n=1 Tax=Methylobacterium mesophilicum SR1.6/6 TaxID=908290 RepID=A0A6B9FKP7_9HYPH|nr:hypothetical protein [Methylobacterium mesophilicum]QGY01488.1 hypothetical protein MMSR116_05910 [Methylobacterium mesophilicum SR1.6/6]
MGGLFVTLDASALARLGNQIGAAGKGAPLALARAINHTGAKARTQMVRALVPQTGLKRKTIVKALRESKASAGSLTYAIKSHGGNIRLKHFGARETRQGVSAAPWGQRSVYAHTFMKAGWWPNRVTKGNWNGQVFERVGSKTQTQHGTKGRGGMDRFTVVRSGLFIPDEMVQGASAAAFNATAATDLPARLEHELGRILGG